MNFPLALKRLVKRGRPPKPLMIGIVITCTALALAVQAAAQQASGSTVSSWSGLANVPTLDSSATMANLKVIPAQMTCAELAQTTQVAGQSIHVTKYQTASASPGAPSYCAVTGHINTYIGFEILLPISTWRQRYLQAGCGGLCGSISIDPPETTAYKPWRTGTSSSRLQRRPGRRPRIDHDGTQLHLARVHLQR